MNEYSFIFPVEHTGQGVEINKNNKNNKYHLILEAAVKVFARQGFHQSTVAQIAKEAKGKGYRVIIAGAGLAAALPGAVAALTDIPVIGLPLDVGPLRGVDALYAMTQLPPGCPVATVGIGNAKNAALLAIRILGID